MTEVDDDLFEQRVRERLAVLRERRRRLMLERELDYAAVLADEEANHQERVKQQ